MYKGMGGFGGNMQNIMRQAQKMQEQMQAQMEKAEQELNEAELIGTAGGGMVTVAVDGHKNLKSIKIQPQAVDPDDIEMLEDLIVASINEANKKAEELEKSLKGDNPIGGLF